MTRPGLRDDDVLFVEYIKNTTNGLAHDEDDEAHSGMTKMAREFLKRKFGTISRFYSGIITADVTEINGFSRIKTLRKALGALDRGGWERSYHQRIFHVSVVVSKASAIFAYFEAACTIYIYKYTPRLCLDLVRAEDSTFKIRLLCGSKCSHARIQPGLEAPPTASGPA